MTDIVVKPVMAVRISRRRPTRRATKPVRGMTTTAETI